ncbi:MAG TPA: hypothetical protein VMU96_14190 [Casimicrobiaceae bacterium]|nr:hypothetical protein [Casimicrobiaceae bacterium]
MATARELLEQADALMRRNRTRQIDTDIPELTDAIATPVIDPVPAAPLALDDIPELTDAVEEIEIASIVEIPDDESESNTWLRVDDEALAAEIVAPRSSAAHPASRGPEPIGGRVLPLFAIAGKPHEGSAAAEADPIVAAMTGAALAKAPVVELPQRDLPPARDGEAEAASDNGVEPAHDGEAGPGPEPSSAQSPEKPEADWLVTEAAAPSTEAATRDQAERFEPAESKDWALWQALAEEIRMQVLQRIDIFTDTGLREQLALQMRPIVERASAEMVETINAQVGELLRAYIAEAIEREIDKWREGNP